jgi:hypothetical protein
MANKNDLSDLAEFFFVSLAIIFVFAAMAKYGTSLVDKKYIRILDAKLSDYSVYMQKQWEGVNKQIDSKRFGPPLF